MLRAQATACTGLLAAWARLQCTHGAEWSLSQLLASRLSHNPCTGAAALTSAAAAPTTPADAAPPPPAGPPAGRPSRKQQHNATGSAIAQLTQENSALRTRRAGIRGGTGSALDVARPITDAALMALIRDAGSLTDMERLLLDHGPYFRHMHIAAALSQLPDLRPPPGNRRSRVLAVLRVLAGSLEASAHRLDPHQLAACLIAFGRLQSAPPVALSRICSRMAAADGTALRAMHPRELAACAKALAALQDEQERAAAEAAERAAAVSGSVSRLRQAGAAVVALPPGRLSEGTPLLSESSPNNQLTPTGTPIAATEDVGAHTTGASQDNALALAPPLETLWRLLPEAARPRLGSFAASDLAGMTWALARTGHASKRFMTDVCRTALPRSAKFDPDGVAALTSALAAAGHVDHELLQALAAEVVAHKAEFNLQQLAGILNAHADLSFYHPAATEAAAKVATRAGALRHSPPAVAATLVAATARLRHADPPLLLAISKLLPGSATVAALGPDRFVEALWALLHLGHRSKAFETAVPQILSALHDKADRLIPSDAARALWCCAVLGEEGDAETDGTGASLVTKLVTRVSMGRPADFSFEELCLLHQATRLLRDEWMTAAPAAAGGRNEEEHGADGEAEGSVRSAAPGGSSSTTSTSSNSGAEAGVNTGEAHLPLTSATKSAATAPPAAVGGTLKADRLSIVDIGTNAAVATPPPPLRLPPRLLRAAATAARHHAAAAATRNSIQQQHVIDLLEDLGLQPVRHMPLDGGALVIDIAMVVGPLKVAVFCDGQGRRTRSPPYERTGYWAVSERLLERVGWRVVHLPWFEWDVLAEGGADPMAALAHLHNSFAAQRIPL